MHTHTHRDIGGARAFRPIIKCCAAEKIIHVSGFCWHKGNQRLYILYVAGHTVEYWGSFRAFIAIYWVRAHSIAFCEVSRRTRCAMRCQHDKCSARRGLTHISSSCTLEIYLMYMSVSVVCVAPKCVRRTNWFSVWWEIQSILSAGSASFVRLWFMLWWVSFASTRSKSTTKRWPQVVARDGALLMKWVHSIYSYNIHIYCIGNVSVVIRCGSWTGFVCVKGNIV